ncbi:hypothetical protein LTR53_002017 [Teratosphaeriaceae sp. CCFEE 6253]|nr:hypothetical protein LTR53_002017 [Teratosphaeriaceae sp. CCFEE 6253]
MRPYSALLLLAALAVAHAQQYLLQSSFSGLSFFDNFDFWTAGDPTFGYVHYVDQPTAEQNGMIKVTNSSAIWGVDTTQVLDPMANLGRLSVRLTSVQSWTRGLFILDLAHMPANQCGVWPAWWMLGSGTWPENGEIDIIEFTNNLPNNLMALHTSESPNCTVAGSGQSGTLLTANCAGAGGYTGCGVSATKPNNIGLNFNRASGGVYAMEWTSTAIRMWFFTRDEVPSSILAASDTGPDPSTFGEPVANFEGSCDIDAHFFNHSMVFDTTFCGSYAGNTWEGDGCPLSDPASGWQSCNNFVATNPQAFVDAYWEVNYLKVYQSTGAPMVTSSGSLSSVLPAIRTSSVSTALSGAQGRSTTPTGIPSPVTTTPTSTPASSLIAETTTTSVVEPSSSMPPESSGATGPYATTIVVVVTVEPESPATMSPQVGFMHQQPRRVVPANNVERLAGAVTTLPGGSTDYCGFPGSACNGLQKRSDVVETHMDPPRIQSSMRTLLTPKPQHTPHVPYVGPNGIVHMPPKERDAEAQALEDGVAVVTTHMDPPRIQSSMRTLLTPKPQHTPHVPYVGPNGIVHMPPKERDAAAQTLDGGAAAFCSMHGSACHGLDGHGRAVGVLTSTSQAPKAGTTSEANGPGAVVKVPKTESSMLYLMGPALETTLWISGSPFVPPPYAPKFYYYDPQSKRAAEAGVTLTTQVKPPTTESSMLYLMGPALDITLWISGTPYTPPPYTPTFYYYDPQSKRTAEPIIPTQVSDAPSTIIADATVIRRAAMLQPTLPTGMYPKEGPASSSTTDKHPGHISSATCMPVIFVDDSGAAGGTGCLAPGNVEITKSEPIIAATMTSTAVLSTFTGQSSHGGDARYGFLADVMAGTAAGPSSVRAMTTVIYVAALSSLVALL